jgi:glutamine amidotransferase
MSGRVVIVDVGMGNLHSVTKAVEVAGRGLALEVVRSQDPDQVRHADRLVMPGQGGFGELSRRVSSGLGEAIVERLRAGTPYFGICLGLQILFERSDEAPGAPGFGWFSGSVQRLQGGPDSKVPHMGWNQLQVRGASQAWLEPGEWFYFVHSYHAVAEEPDVLRAVAGHGLNTVTAAVGRDHVFATQFHPEKSQQAGLSLLARFLRG